MLRSAGSALINRAFQQSARKQCANGWRTIVNSSTPAAEPAADAEVKPRHANSHISWPYFGPDHEGGPPIAFWVRPSSLWRRPASGAPLCRPRKASRGARQKGTVRVDISQSLDTVAPAAAAAAAAQAAAPGILGGKFRLAPEEVQALLKEHKLTEDQLLQLLITPASQLARPPISSFHVGCVCRIAVLLGYTYCTISTHRSACCAPSLAYVATQRRRLLNQKRESQGVAYYSHHCQSTFPKALLSG